VEPVFKQPAIRPLADTFCVLAQSCEAMLCFNGDLYMVMEMNMLVMKVALSTSVVLAALIIVENAYARPLRYRAVPVH
jgi:hypothetical protein